MTLDHLSHRMQIERDTPQQPRPPAHWPEDCAEVVSHEWLRVFRCGVCGALHTCQRDEMLEEDGLACYGEGTHIVQEEPRRSA